MRVWAIEVSGFGRGYEDGRWPEYIEAEGLDMSRRSGKRRVTKRYVPEGARGDARPSTRDGLTRGQDGALLCPFCGEEVTDDDGPYVVTPRAAETFLYCPYCGGELHDCD